MIGHAPETLVVAALKADPQVVALIGTRIYPIRDLPQAPTLPALTYQRITRVGDPLLDSPGHMEDVRLQVNCLAPTFGAVRTLANAVQAALDGKDFSTLEVGISPRLDGNRDLPTELQEGSTLARIHGFSMDFVVTAAEAA